jgi:hypothetical protein
MPPAPSARDHGPMASPHVHIVIDVTTDGHTIVGLVTADDRPPVAFSGRLGILQAIDDAVATIDPDQASDHHP